MTQYFIVSKKWTGKGTHTNDITFYRDKRSGYTVYLESAGRYEENELNNIPIGYDGESETFAVPCHLVEEMALRTVPHENGNLKRLMDWKAHEAQAKE